MAGNVKRNYIYNVVYQIIVIVLPLITTPYVSRVLGADNIGIYAYTQSVANYFVLVAMLGVKNYGNRSIAQIRDDKEQLSKTFVNIFAMQLLMTVAMMVLYAGYILCFVEENKDIAIIQTLFVLTGAADITWFFFGIEEFKTTVIRNTAVRVVSLVLIFLFVREADDLPIYTLIMTGSTLLGYILLFPFLRRHIRFMWPQWSEMRIHIAPNLRLFVSVIAVSIFNVMDKIMLGIQSSMTQVGLYENTDKLMRIPLGVITAMGTVMMPHMSHALSVGDTKGYKASIERSMIFIMCLACALAGGLSGVGQVFAPIFFGEEFIECGTLIAVISPTILSLAWANVIRMQYLIPNKMDREFTISTFIGAGVNLVVNYLLIPRFGALGAVIGTVCAEGSLTFYQTYIVRKSLPIGGYLKATLPFLLMGVAMSVCVHEIGEIGGVSILTLVLQVLAGVVLYVGGTLLYLKKSKQPAVCGFAAQVFEMIGSILKKMGRFKCILRK